MITNIDRIAPTRLGKVVRVAEMTPAPGGWLAYAMGMDGHAVRVFVPRCGRIEMVEDR
jgi:hypothetical protein